MSLGAQNLYETASRHTRRILEDNWVTGSSATTTTIPVVLADGSSVNLSQDIQDQLVGAAIEFTSGANRGVTRQVVAVASDGTLTLDSALLGAPGSGVSFTLLDLSNPASSQTSGGGTPVADCTIPPGTRVFLASGHEEGVDTVSVRGTYRINGMLYAGDDWTQHAGSALILGSGSHVVLHSW